MKSALLAIILFLIFTSLWGFYFSLRPPKIDANLNPTQLGLSYEEVVFQTSDNLKLHGWFIPKQSTDKTIILLHGYPAEKGDILPALSFLSENYNLFLFDFRYLGQSEGRYTYAGAKETEDLRAAIEYLKSRGIKEIGIWGFSMGGAVALMTAPNAPEIKTVVSEASYARLDLMAKELYRGPIINYPLAWLTRFWARIFLGIDLKAISPENAAKSLKIPTLIIHSTNDDLIPFSHALRLKKALKNNSKAEFWFRESLNHGQLGKEYQERVSEFFRKNL